jgi:hypothetical protein
VKIAGRLTILLAVSLFVRSLAMASETPSGDASLVQTVTATPSDDSDSARTYGTASLVAQTIGAFAFATRNSSDTYAGGEEAGQRFLTNGGFFAAPVDLPAGAVISRFEIQGCDESATGEVLLRLGSSTISGGVVSSILHGSLTTGATATPGCGFFSANLPSSVVVDNLRRVYFVRIFTTATDISTRFYAVRLYYNLQVSPAPATATFTDVPTSHPFFRFIEALVDAGITAGCNVSPPRYCPDTFVTRGQMAVFISKALGLHFAP